MSAKNNHNLTQVIIGVFIGTAFGLYFTLSYWGNAWYQIILAILGGSLLGYFCVNPIRAWQQTQTAVKQSITGMFNLFKKWKPGYLVRRMLVVLLVLTVISLIFSFYEQPFLSFPNPNRVHPITLSNFAAAFLVCCVYLIFNFASLVFCALPESLIFNVWKKYLILREVRKENEPIIVPSLLIFQGQRNEKDIKIIFLSSAGPWWDYEWRFLIASLVALIWVMIYICLLFLLLLISGLVVLLRMPIWFLAILSTQPLFLKIFAGTALAVMSGSYYLSYSVGFVVAAIYSLLLFIFKLFDWRSFNLFAFLQEGAKLRLAFAKLNNVLNVLNS